MKKLLIVLLLCSCSPKITTLEKEKQKTVDKSEAIRKGKILIVVIGFIFLVDYGVDELREK